MQLPKPSPQGLSGMFWAALFIEHSPGDCSILSGLRTAAGHPEHVAPGRHQREPVTSSTYQCSQASYSPEYTQLGSQLRFLSYPIPCDFANDFLFSIGVRKQTANVYVTMKFSRQIRSQLSRFLKFTSNFHHTLALYLYDYLTVVYVLLTLVV